MTQRRMETIMNVWWRHMYLLCSPHGMRPAPHTPSLARMLGTLS
jgi:hypothetical protein